MLIQISEGLGVSLPLDHRPGPNRPVLQPGFLSCLVRWKQAPVVEQKTRLLPDWADGHCSDMYIPYLITGTATWITATN